METSAARSSGDRPSRGSDRGGRGGRGEEAVLVVAVEVLVEEEVVRMRKRIGSL